MRSDQCNWPDCRFRRECACGPCPLNAREFAAPLWFRVAVSLLISALFLLVLITAITKPAKAQLSIPVVEGRAQIDCAVIRQIATPHFIARADRDVAALPAASPLVLQHAAFKRLVAACTKG